MARRVEAEEHADGAAKSRAPSTAPGESSVGQPAKRRDRRPRRRCRARRRPGRRRSESATASTRNCSRMWRRLGADRHADADLARPLGHRHQQDVHDPDAADQQRDRRDREQQVDITWLALSRGARHVVEGAHREVVVLGRARCGGAGAAAPSICSAAARRGPRRAARSTNGSCRRCRGARCRARGARRWRTGSRRRRPGPGPRRSGPSRSSTPITRNGTSLMRITAPTGSSPAPKSLSDDGLAEHGDAARRRSSRSVKKLPDGDRPVAHRDVGRRRRPGRRRPVPARRTRPAAIVARDPGDGRAPRGTSAAIASASATVSVEAPPQPERTPPPWSRPGSPSAGWCRGSRSAAAPRRRRPARCSPSRSPRRRR